MSTPMSTSTTTAPSPTRSTLPPSVGWVTPVDWYEFITRPSEFLDEKARRFGNAFTVPNFRGKPIYVYYSDPEAIREIFAGAPDELHAGEANYLVEGLLGSHSLLVLDGEAHRRERKLMTPPFHGERMRGYGSVMREIAGAAIEAWPMGRSFAALDEMQAITLDVILRTVFGIDEGPKLSRLRELLREVLARATHPVLFAAMMVVRPVRLKRWLESASAPRRLFGKVTVDPGALVPGSKLIRLVQEVDALLFAEFARGRERGTEGRQDVMSMLLDARDESGAPMTDVELRDELMTLLLAGHETTATTLAWSLHHLMRNPEAAAKLQAELVAAAPLKNGGGNGTSNGTSDEKFAFAPIPTERLNELPYLDATIKEAMRLTPVVPAVARVLKRPLRLGGYDLPAGLVLVPNIYLTHRRPDLWPEPEQFRPERFIERKPSPYEFFPFGGGVRRCIGAAFATYEIKIVLAEILRRVRVVPVTADDGPPPFERRGILFGPRGGVPIVVEKFT